MDWPPNNVDILKAIEALFQSGKWWVYKGEVVREFERCFAQSHDCGFGVSVCNGTVALDIVLRALGVGPGDRVVLPAYNFYSSPKSVTNVGATPVFVDVCPENLTIDVDRVQSIVQSRVKAVVAVHISGSVARLDELQAICRAAGVYLIEDCAQAAGARYAHKRVGSWGDAGVFSFGGVKLMTCGQGGMITTSDPELYEKCYAIVNRGMRANGTLNTYGIIGDNYQLSDLAAVTLGPQLAILDELCATRERTMQFLDRELETFEGLAPLRQFAHTTCRAQMRYSFLYDASRFSGMSRGQFIQEADQRQIPLAPGYACVSQDARLFHGYAVAEDFPVARAAHDSVVAIHHPYLLHDLAYWKETVEQIRTILTPTTSDRTRPAS